MANNINNNKSLTHECNVLSNILNRTKRAKKTHYPTILAGCINNRILMEIFINFRILLDSGIRSEIVMGKLTSKIVEKININNYMGNSSREVHDLIEGERRFLSAII